MCKPAYLNMPQTDTSLDDFLIDMILSSPNVPKDEKLAILNQQLADAQHRMHQTANEKASYAEDQLRLSLARITVLKKISSYISNKIARKEQK